MKSKPSVVGSVSLAASAVEAPEKALLCFGVLPLAALAAFGALARPALGADSGGVAVPDPERFIVPVMGWGVDSWALNLFGLIAQAFFSLRILLQAWESKRQGQSVTPPSFWYTSFAAGLMLALYFFVRSEPVNLTQQVLMTAIYMRNIYMIRKEKRGPRFNRPLAKGAFGFFALILLFFLYCVLRGGGPSSGRLHVADPDIIQLPLTGILLSSSAVNAFGFIGMAIFSGRFIVQWLASERARRSVVPTSFWAYSAIGSLILLLYNVAISSPIAILGQATGLPTYVYNLRLIRRSKRAPMENEDHAFDV